MSDRPEPIKSLLQYANDTVALLSLLYDLDLLPEQLQEPSHDWERMLLLIQSWKDRADKLDQLRAAGLFINDSNRALAERNVQLRAERDRLKELLSVAKCPNCEGSGSYVRQTGEDTCEEMKCEWCSERYSALNEPKP